MHFQSEEEEKISEGGGLDNENEDKLNLSVDSVVSKRGRKAIPDQWTGIMRVEGPDMPVQL